MTSPVPRVSVLMPVRDTAPFVEAACRSILGQTLRELELVVVDDGSTDESPRVVAALAARDPRVRLVRRECRGLIPTRNELLERARAPVVAWMDSDDVSPPRRLERQVARLEANPRLVFTGGAVLEIDPDGDPIQRHVYPPDHSDIVAGLRSGWGALFGTTAMRRDVALGVGGFREPFRVGEDLDLLLRMSERGEAANDPEVHLHYRLHLRSTSRQLTERWGVYRDAILALADERAATGSDRLQRGEPLQLELPPPRAPQDLRWWSHAQWARLASAAGFPLTARKHALRALRLAPHRAASWKLNARVLLRSLGRG